MQVQPAASNISQKILRAQGYFTWFSLLEWMSLFELILHFTTKDHLSVGTVYFDMCLLRLLFLQVMGHRVWGMFASVGGSWGAGALHSLWQQKDCQWRLRRVSHIHSYTQLCAWTHRFCFWRCAVSCLSLQEDQGVGPTSSSGPTRPRQHIMSAHSSGEYNHSPKQVWPLGSHCGNFSRQANKN